MRILTKKTEQLECILTDEEFRTRASALAAVCQDIGREEGRQAQIKADMKAEMARLEAERSRLTLIVVRKAETRDVQVRVEADDAAAEAVTIREDTNVVVRRRALELRERQPKLPGADPDNDPAEAQGDDPGAETTATKATACTHGVDITADTCEACEAQAQADTQAVTDDLARRAVTPADIQAVAAQRGRAARAAKNRGRR